MIYLPVTLILFLILLLLLPFLWFALAIDVVQVAAAKLGFSRGIAILLFALIIIGSTINIPLYRIESQVEIPLSFQDIWLARYWGIPLQKVPSYTVVALNVGGGLIPVLLALYQFGRSNILAIILSTAIVTLVSYYSAHIVPGIGIHMNPLVSPLTAVLSAVLLTKGIPVPPVAFASGVLGTLIGADLLHLAQIEKMTVGVLSIGGAGVFDGIALCGLFALLLS
ncbi:DUF1614 domain-containing protein [Pleurocapsales cyanobacterium LEGE 10410]|nr:DUF1614 domain-containing protein [Pleurocapsales cyanobacterium LEGE 10410]